MTNMNIVPTREKHDATRSVVSSDFSWAFDREATMATEHLWRVVADI